MGRHADNVGQFEKALTARRKRTVVLRLYVAGGTATSMRALHNLRAICRDHMEGRHKLEVIDVYQDAEALRRDEVVVVPTLVKAAPLPVRRIIGDLSNLGRVLVALNIEPKGRRDAAQARKTGR